MTRAVLSVALWASLFLPSPLCAQSAWVQGGTSTLMSASGVQLDYRWNPAQGWIGIGYSDGLVGGGYVSTRYRNLDFGAGDRYQQIGLQTDIFDTGRYFSGRGVFVSGRGENQSWSAFAGATTGERAFNFFHAFQTEQATGGFFYDRKFKRFSLSSFTIAQDKLSSIHTVRYTVNPNLKLSAGAGVGYNSHFASVGAQYSGHRVLLDASYTNTGDSFQRIHGVATNGPEHVGANVRFRYQPFRRLGLTLAHENLFSPVLAKGEQSRKVSMNSATVTTSLKGFNLGASATQSKSGSLESKFQNLNISRQVTRSITASSAFMRMEINGNTSNIWIGNVQEKITPRFSLNQGITKQGNNNSLTMGGRFISNRITVGLQHDMVYSTLAGGFGGRSSMHVWTVNLIARLFDGITLHTDSLVDPTGKVRYTAWADGIGIGKMEPGEQARPTQGIPSFSKFVVKGLVQDTDGKPVWGISVHVDGQNAYSDSAGRFFLRFKRGEQYPLSINPEQSLNTIIYRIVRAPVSVLAEPEDEATPVIIVVERDIHYTPPKKKRAEVDTPGSPVQSSQNQSDESVGTDGTPLPVTEPGS